MFFRIVVAMPVFGCQMRLDTLYPLVLDNQHNIRISHTQAFCLAQPA